MNDVADRLSDLLTRSAEVVDVRPDLDAVTQAADDTVVVRLTEHPSRTRRRLALVGIAAAALLVVAAAAVVAGRSGSEPVGVTDAPLGPAARFPVLGDLPAVLEGPVDAIDGEGVNASAAASTFPFDTPVVSAAIGREAADGSVNGLVLLVAAAYDRSDRERERFGAVEALGDGYEVATLRGVEEADAGLIELYGPGTTVQVYGGAAGFDWARREAGRGLTATVDGDGRPVLGLGSLPDGYSVVAPPAADPEDPEAEVSVGADVDGASLVAETGVGDPSHALAALTAGGSYAPIDIGGSPGLVSTKATELAAPLDTTTVVAWTAPNGVTVRVHALLSEAETVRVARELRLVDADEWVRIYPDAETATTPDDGLTAADRAAVTAEPPGGHTTTTSPSGSSVPLGPARFPVLGEVPERFDEASAQIVTPTPGAGPGEVAVIGRRDGPDVLDAVLVESYAWTPTGENVFAIGDLATPITVGGRDAVIGPRGGTVVDGDVLQLGIAGTPALLLTGPDRARLEEVAALVTAVLAGGTAALDMGDVPNGEVIHGPVAAPIEARPVVAATAPPTLGVWVETSDRDPLELVAPYGSLESWAVGGAPGWISVREDGTDVAWQAEDGTTVHVRGAVTRAEVDAIAAEVELVDEAAWRSTYEPVLDPPG